MSDLPVREVIPLHDATASSEVKYQAVSGSEGRKNLVQLQDTTEKEPEHPSSARVTNIISNAQDVKQSASSGHITSRLATSTHVDGSRGSQPYGTPEQTMPMSILPISPVLTTPAISSRGYDLVNVQPGASDNTSPRHPVPATISQLSAPQAPYSASMAPNLSSQGHIAHPRLVTRETNRAASQGTPYSIPQSKSVPGSGSTPESSKVKADSPPSVAVSTMSQSVNFQPKMPAEVHNMRNATPQGRRPLDHVVQGVCPLCCKWAPCTDFCASQPPATGVVPAPHPRIERVASTPVQTPAPESGSVVPRLKPTSPDCLFPPTISAHLTVAAKPLTEPLNSSYSHPPPQSQTIKELGKLPSLQVPQKAFDSDTKCDVPSDELNHSGASKGVSTSPPTQHVQSQSATASTLPNNFTASDDTHAHTRSRSDEVQRQQHVTPFSQQSFAVNPTTYPTWPVHTITPSNAKSRAHSSNYRTTAPATPTAHTLMTTTARPVQDGRGNPPIISTPTPQVSDQAPLAAPSAPSATQSTFTPYSLASQTAPLTDSLPKTREMPALSSSIPLNLSQSQHHAHRSGTATPLPIASGPPTSRTHHQHSVSLPTNYPTSTTSGYPRTHYTRTGPTSVPPPSAPNDPSSVATSTRVPISGHLSTPAPPRAQHLPGSPSGESLLNTPSSIAPSLPQRPPSRASLQATQESSKKKGGFLSIFRSKNPPVKSHEIWYPPAETKPAEPTDSRTKTRSSSKPVDKTSYKQSSPLHGKEKLTASSSAHLNVEAPAPRPWTATSTVTQSVPVPSSDRKSPGSKILSPFRLLGSHRRYRTVSAASLEALDGTATAVSAPLTIFVYFSIAEFRSAKHCYGLSHPVNIQSNWPATGATTSDEGPYNCCQRVEEQGGGRVKGPWKEETTSSWCRFRRGRRCT
jgi:hypothetical protein